MDHLVKEKNGSAIQQAIDHAAASGGGRVVLEPGEYLSGTLYLKSNIELHLPAGAVIRGYDKSELYDDFCHPGFDAVTPENSRKCLIACADCENVSITGTGTVDGQGPEFYDRSNLIFDTFWGKPPWPRPRMIQFYNCRNILFEGVTFLNSPGWTFWLISCEDIRVSRIRIIGDQRMVNNDGIDIDGCRRVSVSDSFFQTGDDCLILRAIRRDAETQAVCEQVTVCNCVLDSMCQGIRLGCPSDDTIRNCSFRGITFRGRGSGITSWHPYLYLRKNCTGYADISDISFDDFDIDTRAFPIRIGCEGGIALRGIRRISFSNFRIRAQRPILFSGSAETIMSDITLKDFSGNISSDTPVEARFVRNLELDRFRITAETGDAVPFERKESHSWESKF